MNSDKFHVAMVFEVLGKPAEHLTATLNQIIEKLGKEKGVKLVTQKIHEPAPYKAKEGFFTNFAELEIEVDDVIILSNLMFGYMPAHVEIIQPEKLNIQNNDLNEFFNGLMRKLHGYDEVARILQTEKIILERKLKELTKSPEKKD